MFTLDNSTETFAIQRPYEGYEDLKTQIRIGDSLKIYYKPDNSDYNKEIFQIEKRNSIIQSYNDYLANYSTKHGLDLILGFILTTVAILYYRNFNLVKFLNSWVDVKKDQ